MIQREAAHARHWYLGAPALLASTLAASCHPGNAEFPWGKPSGSVASQHASVRTLNAGYQRTSSHVLVREIDHPTRATLDYAAYHANFMIADPEPENLRPGSGSPDTDKPFEGLVDPESLSADIARTPLTTAEWQAPLAFAPLVEFLLAHKVAGADTLEALGAAVRSENWGLPGTPGASSQSISDAFLHSGASGAHELWVKVEFAPWFTGLGKLPDQDGDGVPEIYAHASAALSPKLLATIEHDYVGGTFGAAELKAWANQLSSYWYPSFNTDLVPPGSSWPDERTEDDIKNELKGHVFASPSLVLRGKPQGTAAYDIFIVKGLDAGALSNAASPSAGLSLKKTKPTPNTAAISELVQQELAANGGSWASWAAKLAPFRDAVHKRLAATPKTVKALAGQNGFIFFRNELESASAGDLEKQAAGRNPLPVIVEFKNQLTGLGVDFLFVPVPSKVEIFPDEFDPKFKDSVGKVVNPWGRKFLASLAEQGVEVVDLWTPLLAARAAGDADGQETLYQHQDTHWSARGLELAAGVLAKRIVKYPWYTELARHGIHYEKRATTFTRFGDLHSRLPPALQKKYQPETLAAQQVLRPDGAVYDDDADSPIVVLGDSFTGVYELTDAEHAGLSAHVSRGVSYPADLVMSYGGGPNVRNKLMRIGSEALGQKKLVIWVMAARDLYNYWEDWEPLKAP
jgi:alginate O-acetyltransferase complex protein AlgJ